MLGEDEHADCQKHDESREGDGLRILMQHLPAGSLLIEVSLEHEDRIVIPLTEDEGSEDDVDDIEVQVKDHHQDVDNSPTDYHRQEGNQSVDNAAETDAEEDEYDDRADEAEVVEMAGDRLGDLLVHRLGVEAAGPKRS